MIRLIWILLFASVFRIDTDAQSAIEQSFHIGHIIPNNRVFPEVERVSFMSETSYVRYTNGAKSIWPSFYRFPVLSVSFAYETMGNKAQLGEAISITPTLGFYLFKKKNVNLQLETGIGIAFLGKHFDKIKHPDNSINGSLINFSWMTSFLLEWELTNRVKLVAGPGLAHYSNGNYANPNVGANVPSWELGLRYIPVKETVVKEKLVTTTLQEIPKRIHPFVRIAAGITERGLDGPKFLVSSGALGINRQFGRTHRLSTGLSFMLDKATLVYQKHIGLNPGKEFKNASRYVLFIGHEFLFGHIGFPTEAGFYLNKFEGKSSILSFKLGFNFYPLNTFKKMDHLPYLGLYIQSSFGEAEFVELATGYLF